MEVMLGEIRAACENVFAVEVPGENGRPRTVRASAFGRVLGQPEIGVPGYSIGGKDGYRWLKLVRICEAENARALRALADLAMEHALRDGDGEPVHPVVTSPSSSVIRTDPLTGKTVRGAVVEEETGELVREADQVVIDPARLAAFEDAAAELLEETVEIRVRPPRASSLLRRDPDDPGARVFEDLQLVGVLEPFMEMDALEDEAWEDPPADVAGAEDAPEEEAVP